MEPFTQNIHLLTKQQLPNPAGSPRSPAGEQELTRSGDRLSRECCHFCCHFCCHICGWIPGFIGKAGGTQDRSWESPWNAKRAEEELISRGWNGGNSSPTSLQLTAANFTHFTQREQTGEAQLLPGYSSVTPQLLLAQVFVLYRNKISHFIQKNTWPGLMGNVHQTSEVLEKWDNHPAWSLYSTADNLGPSLGKNEREFLGRKEEF